MPLSPCTSAAARTVHRSDGWTPERQAIILATLRVTCSIARLAAACRTS
jgi:hypothetical protein